MEEVTSVLGLLDELDFEEIEQVSYKIPRVIPQDRSDPMSYLTEDEFVHRYHFTKEGVRDLYEEIKPCLPRVRNRRGCSVPAYLQLLVAMRYMAAGSFQVSVADCGEMSAASVCRFVKRMTDAIAHMAPAHVRFPAPEEASLYTSTFYDIAGMPGVIGCIDGLHIKIQNPGCNKTEIYKCNKGYASINVQGICDAQLKFINIESGSPGSTQDSKIFEKSSVYTRLKQGGYEGHLLGDTKFPCLEFLLTPVLTPENDKEKKYNASHSQTRSAIVRAFEILKRRFACLSFLRTKLETSRKLIIACAVMHNIAISRRFPLVSEYAEDSKDIEREQIAEQNPDDDHDGTGIEDDIVGSQKRSILIEKYF